MKTHAGCCQRPILNAEIQNVVYALGKVRRAAMVVNTMNRRQFLSQTVTATSVFGIAGGSIVVDAAAKSPNGNAQSLIDTHVYLGHWPHARLASDDPSELMQLLHQDGVTQAWVGSFEGLFHKDIAAVNSRLAENCSKYGDGILVPFGTVNPTLPDWEDDLRRCDETHHMPGIRLHPGYHGYTLADSRFTRLLMLAAKARLVVQLVVWLDDAKHRWLTPAANNTDLRPASVTGGQDGPSLPATPLRMMILGSRAEDIPHWKSAFTQAEVYFDFPRCSPASQQVFIDALDSPERIVFGSGAPLRPLHPLSTALVNSNITDDRRHAVQHELAAEIIGRR